MQQQQQKQLNILNIQIKKSNPNKKKHKKSQIQIIMSITQLVPEVQKQPNTTNLCYVPMRDTSHLSPYHQRVSIQKQYIRKKQQLRSILIMGHLQKMELNAINNRSQQTMMKAKKAQQMSKKRNLSIRLNQKRKYKNQIKIDTRKNCSLMDKSIQQDQNDNQEVKRQSIEQLCDQLIDQYLQKAAKQKILDKNLDRKKIIEEACKTIQSQITQRLINSSKKQQEIALPNHSASQRSSSTKKKNTMLQSKIQLPTISETSKKKAKNRDSQRSLLHSTKKQPETYKSHESSYLKLRQNNNLNNMSLDQQHNKKSQQKYFKGRKSNRYRSITQIEYNQNMKKLQIEKKYLSKQRLLDQKLFLRKMKMIGIKNLNTLKTSLRDYQKSHESRKQTIQ